LTPLTRVLTSPPLAGAEIKTFFAPAFKCLEAVSFVLKTPVDSTTTSTSKCFHGNCSGSLSL